MRVDTNKIRQRINEISERQRVLKYQEHIRAIPVPSMSSSQCLMFYEFFALRREATILCSLMAHLRHRVHCQGSTLEKQAELVNQAMSTYELKTEIKAAS